MSFINIAAKSQKDKFKPTKVVCCYCRDPDLKLKFRGRNSQGRIEYTDLETDSLHLCKDKFTRCKRCGTEGLQWIKSANVISGFELKDKLGNLHNCSGRAVSTYMEELAYFWDRVVLKESDPIETIRAKEVMQDRLVGRDESGLTYAEREIQKLPDYKLMYEQWGKWDFSKAKRPKPTIKIRK